MNNNKGLIIIFYFVLCYVGCDIWGLTNIRFPLGLNFGHNIPFIIMGLILTFTSIGLLSWCIE